MNYYLLFLSLYTLCIFPAALWVDLRLGPKITYDLHLGLPRISGGTRKRAWWKGRKEPKEDSIDKDVDVKEDSLLSVSPAVLRAIFSRPVWRAARRLVDRGRVYLFVRCAFPDAALTALSYAAVNTLLEVLRRAGTGWLELEAKTELSFEAEGSRLALRGIFILRLGSIALMAAHVLVRYRKIRAQDNAREKPEDRFHLKEGQYAASHR